MANLLPPLRSTSLKAAQTLPTDQENDAMLVAVYEHERKARTVLCD
jgi:hypothetical protein